MDIRYICCNCKEELGISGFRAVNEVGRKQCDRCGCGGDHLEVVSKQEFDKARLKVDKRTGSSVRRAHSVRKM